MSQLPRPLRCVGFCLLAMMVFAALGCGADPSGPSDLDTFNRAGPLEPKLDRSKLTVAPSVIGEYQIDIGDQLLIRMPQVIATLSNRSGYAANRIDSIVTRVDEDGSATVPIIGRIKAYGMTLRDFESKLQETYSPRYFSLPPAVAVSVTEHRTYQVRITGAVKEPGVYQLRRDELSLASLLTKAKGVKEEGAGVIRLVSPEGQATAVALPVMDMDIPFLDAPIQPGMTVEVQQLARREITVFGLVGKPGSFPYPVDVEYSLAQALGLAGGILYKQDPRRASVYRTDENGNLVAAVFDVGGEKNPEFAAIMLKPGDIVAVQPTVYTTARQLIPQLFKFSLSFNTGSIIYE